MVIIVAQFFFFTILLSIFCLQLTLSFPGHYFQFSYNHPQGKGWRDWASCGKCGYYYFWMDGILSALRKYVKYSSLCSWQMACKFYFWLKCLSWPGINCSHARWILLLPAQVKDGLVLPDKASLYLTAIEDADYKEDKIECELFDHCELTRWVFYVETVANAFMD